MTWQLLLHNVVAVSVPALLALEELRDRRRPLPPMPSRSPVRNPNDERVVPRAPMGLTAS